jgi:hypothetical protein
MKFPILCFLQTDVCCKYDIHIVRVNLKLQLCYYLQMFRQVLKGGIAAESPLGLLADAKVCISLPRNYVVMII